MFCESSITKNSKWVFIVRMPVAVRSKAWACDHSLPEITSSNPALGMDVLSLVHVVCPRVKVFETGRSPIQSSSIARARVCVSLNAIRCKNNPLHLPLLSRERSDWEKKIMQVRWHVAEFINFCNCKHIQNYLFSSLILKTFHIACTKSYERQG